MIAFGWLIKKANLEVIGNQEMFIDVLNGQLNIGTKYSFRSLLFSHSNGLVVSETKN